MNQTKTCGLLAAGALMASMLAAPSAEAWYFPEHAELTRLGLEDFAPQSVAAALESAIDDARTEGLLVCRGVNTKLQAMPAADAPDACVPYGALAALAGDHANTTTDLGQFLSEPLRRWTPAPNRPLSILLTDAARDTWVAFQSDAEPEAVRVWTMPATRAARATVQALRAENPKDFVRSLDAELLVIDPGYITRAKGAKTHFHDPTSALPAILQQAALGGLDNVFAQMLAHHARSLQLAALARRVKGRDRALLRREALLEHAFALHFVEDAFSAGHVATDPAVAADERRAGRHDYFNRQGLALTRALANYRCQAKLENSLVYGVGLEPCWVAHGDGFATGQDRLYAGEAVARLQTAFGLALAPVSDAWLNAQLATPACSSWLAGEAPSDACDLAWMAMLLDPNPEWVRGKTCDSPVREWGPEVIRRYQTAVEHLAREPLLKAANAGTPCGQPGTLTDAVVGAPLDESELEGRCVYDDPRAALWRPLLAAWPDAQADIVTLAGSDVLHRGFQAQIVASAAGSMYDPANGSRSLALWNGLGAGLAFAAQGLFPHRGSRSFFELNAGFAQGILQGNNQPHFPSLLVAELRIPVTTLALYGIGALWHSRTPLNLLGAEMSTGLMGARAYWSTADRPQLVGWDAEVLNWSLGAANAEGAASAGLLDMELRVRLGVRTEDLSRLRSFFGGAPFFAFELTSGYYYTLK
jgi:hypothetical protein